MPLSDHFIINPHGLKKEENTIKCQIWKSTEAIKSLWIWWNHHSSDCFVDWYSWLEVVSFSIAQLLMSCTSTNTSAHASVPFNNDSLHICLMQMNINIISSIKFKELYFKFSSNCTDSGIALFINKTKANDVKPCMSLSDRTMKGTPKSRLNLGILCKRF